MAFKIMSRNTWRLSENIALDRKRKLLAIPYEKIVRLIVSKAKLTRLRVEKSKKVKGFRRVKVTLRVPASVVDLFHSGAGGYRAQYYVSVKSGEHANRFLIKAIQETVWSQAVAMPRRRLALEFARKSLSDPSAKVWIHQGRWLRTKRLDERNLQVARWLKSDNVPKKHFRIWAQLTPRHETELEIIGGWLDKYLNRRDSMKPKRSKEIMQFGFT